MVDAYPNREFNAVMRQFRLAPNVVQNVVTYNVVLDVDNQDELLKPGMTAQVRLVTDTRPKALRIPTAALRFRLSDEELEKERKRAKDGNKDDRNAAVKTVAATPAAAQDDDLALQDRSETARLFKVYKLDARNQPQPVDVRIGLSNFRYTEIVSGNLKPGERIITRSLQPNQGM